MIDTHAHLEPDEAGEVLERARAAGVSRVVTVATTLGRCPRGARARRRARRACTRASESTRTRPATTEAGRLDELRELFADPRAVAVGETGLDYFRDYAPHDAQRRLFDAHLELAAELGKPVVIHTRAADEDTARALAGFGGTVILHCFSSPGLLDPALERGWYVSFAGNVTYPKAPELREAAARVPADRLLAETDSPYLAPQPVRGRRNEPAFVMHTLATLAEVRGDDPGALEAQIDANASAAFGL